jgi:F5/8 type C domain
MKRCVQCHRSYEDDSLNFCLEDGAVLSSGADPNPIHVRATQPDTPVPAPEPPATVRFGDPGTAATLHARRTVTDSATRSGPPPRRLVLISVTILGGLCLLAATVVGALYLMRNWMAPTTSEPAQSSAPNATPTAPETGTPSTTPEPGQAGRPIVVEGVKRGTAPLRINVSASSVRYAQQANTYEPENVMDGRRQTAWLEGAAGPGIGSWLRFDFDREIQLHRILILPGYFKSAQIWSRNNRVARASLEFSDGSSRQASFPDQMTRQTIDVGTVQTRWVKLVIDDVYSGSDPDTAISEVVFEWEPARAGY